MASSASRRAARNNIAAQRAAGQAAAGGGGGDVAEATQQPTGKPTASTAPAPEPAKAPETGQPAGGGEGDGLVQHCVKCGFRFSRRQRRQTCQSRVACDTRQADNKHAGISVDPAGQHGPIDKDGNPVVVAPAARRGRTTQATPSAPTPAPADPPAAAGTGEGTGSGLDEFLPAKQGEPANLPAGPAPKPARKPGTGRKPAAAKKDTPSGSAA